jgi:hypothetical protein
MKNYKLVLSCIILSILFLAFALTFITKPYYKIELYVKKPGGEELKIRECWNDAPNFDCSQEYKECSEPGEYYSKAITYCRNSILSDSGWRLVYKC